jgi:hypothetical protein
MRLKLIVVGFVGGALTAGAMMMVVDEFPLPDGVKPELSN